MGPWGWIGASSRRTAGLAALTLAVVGFAAPGGAAAEVGKTAGAAVKTAVSLRDAHAALSGWTPDHGAVFASGAALLTPGGGTLPWINAPSILPAVASGHPGPARDAGHAGPAAGCASCHASEAATQPRTPMAQALGTPGANALLGSHPKLTYHRGAYSYLIETVVGKTTYTVTDGKDSISVPVRWGFGLGSQTWVLEHDGKLYQSEVSYYPAIDGLDITTGVEGVTPQSLEEAMGHEIAPRDARLCFGCHATNILSNGNLSLETLQPGVRCEHCHEGSLTHAADAAQGAFDTIPRKLGQMSSEDVLNFCGQCHRTWETVARAGWRGPQNIRFQAYRLANSRCFDGADSRISCIGCHDPHKNLATGAAWYDAKCLACHGPSAIAADAARQRPAAGMAHEQAKTCPVAQSNCTSCHMPKVTLPGGNGHLAFTDHQIRIVRPGDPYPN